jgi:hypothetical protein
MITDPPHGADESFRALPSEEGDVLDPERPLAVFLVGGEDTLGPAGFGMFGSRYAKEYPQILFVSIGIMDQAVVDAGVDGSGNFKGSEEAQRLRLRTRETLQTYLDEARSLGLKAARRVSVSVNAAEEIARLSDEISAAHPKAVYFLSKLVFEKPRWFHRWLYGGTSDLIRKKLEQKGRPVTVLPVVVAL